MRTSALLLSLSLALATSAVAQPVGCDEALAKVAAPKRSTQWSMRTWMMGNVVLAALLGSATLQVALREETIGVYNLANQKHIAEASMEELIETLGEQRLFYLLAVHLTTTSFTRNSDTRNHIGKYLEDKIKAEPQGEIARAIQQKGIPLGSEELRRYLRASPFGSVPILRENARPIDYFRYLGTREVAKLAATALAEDWKEYEASGNPRITFQDYLKMLQLKIEGRF